MSTKYVGVSNTKNVSVWYASSEGIALIECGILIMLTCLVAASGATGIGTSIRKKIDTQTEPVQRSGGGVKCNDPSCAAPPPDPTRGPAPGSGAGGDGV